ncbi:MAG: endolytic transglycosylase MltG [Chloroflexota bacterium]|nr:MAG: endolytic transglycosylase MltG [Chloroflexota bacterium]
MGKDPAEKDRRSRPRAQDSGSSDNARRRSSRILQGARNAVAGLLALLLVVLAIGLAVGGRSVLDPAIDLIDHPAGTSDETTLFVVQPGATADEIAESLKSRGLIANPLLFRFLIRYYDVAERLSAGEYELSPGMTSTEILSRLNRGLVRTTTVTLIEGWRLEEIAQALEKRGIFPAADFRKAAAESYSYAFLPTTAGKSRLEGYLFPDTYIVRAGMQPADFVREMLENFDRRVSPITQRLQLPNGLALHEVVTLASIVEREAALPEERPIIAAVFLNRLRQGMRLDADPTLQYAIAPAPVDGQPTIFWKKNLTNSDKQVASPYNTYRVAGLPPGPICNPGLASIKAVLEPASVDYLYFMARGDGSHAFARTLDEHLDNAARYQ